MERIYLTQEMIKALYDSVIVIHKNHPQSDIRFEIYQDPESGQLECGMMEISGVTIEDCENIQPLLREDINQRPGGIYIVTDVWYKEGDK